MATKKDTFDQLLERSSLGERSVRQLASRTSKATAQRIVDLARKKKEGVGARDIEANVPRTTPQGEWHIGTLADGETASSSRWNRSDVSGHRQTDEVKMQVLAEGVCEKGTLGIGLEKQPRSLQPDRVEFIGKAARDMRLTKLHFLGCEGFLVERVSVWPQDLLSGEPVAPELVERMALANNMRASMEVRVSLVRVPNLNQS